MISNSILFRILQLPNQVIMLFQNLFLLLLLHLLPIIFLESMLRFFQDTFIAYNTVFELFFQEYILGFNSSGQLKINWFFKVKLNFFQTQTQKKPLLQDVTAQNVALQSAFFYCPYAVLPFIHQDIAIKPKKNPVILLKPRSFNFLPQHRRTPVRPNFDIIHFFQPITADQSKFQSYDVIGL